MHPLIADLIDRYGTPSTFERGQTFVRQGMAMPTMYYLCQGKVKIEQSVVSGKSLLVGFAGGGSWLGDLELFSDNHFAHSTVTSVTAVSGFRFSIDAIRQHLVREPAMTAIFARSLAEKMWTSSKNSAINLLYPLRQRYAAYLYEMSTASAELPIALETSAGLLGAGERQLQRVLREMAESGIVERSGRLLKIVDRQRLREIAVELLGDAVSAGAVFRA